MLNIMIITPLIWHVLASFKLVCELPDDKGKKGKAIPLQTWGGPEGSRRLRLPDFKTIGT
jgi:hypothetical protein